MRLGGGATRNAGANPKESGVITYTFRIVVEPDNPTRIAGAPMPR